MGGSRRATSGLWQVPLTHLLLHVQAASWLCGRTSVQGSVVAAVAKHTLPFYFRLPVYLPLCQLHNKVKEIGINCQVTATKFEGYYKLVVLKFTSL